MSGSKAPDFDTYGSLRATHSYRGGSQGLSPTYEQAHVGLDLLTLVSLYYFVTYYVKQKRSCLLMRLILRNRFHINVDIWVKLW